MDPKTTQGLMGHIRTTLRIYTQFEEDRAREAVGRIDGLLGAAFRSPSDGTYVSNRRSAGQNAV